jgi:plasmid maintenance system antidote protein VapI
MKNKSTNILLRLIESRETSQADVSKSIGITRQHLGAILNGKYYAGRKTAVKLAKWAGPESGVSVLDLMGLKQS